MSGIYIHVPFCRKACHYCDFYFSTSLRGKEDFIKALIRETDLRKDYLTDKKISTIYFGGGTPSVLTHKEMEIILSKIRSCFLVDDAAEITLEANPDDLSADYIDGLMKTGVNRLSIGVQSFDNSMLKWMNRSHDAVRAVESIYAANNSGIKNISIDLIYALPGLSNELWQQTLEIAARMPVSHISCYSLTVEEKTALGFFVRKGKVKLPDELLAEKHFETLRNIAAKNNFEQYEISNFARNRNYSIHNSNYWNGTHYLGLGPSAHSYNGHSRQWNMSNNFEYIRMVNEKRQFFELEKLSTAQKYNEYIMTGLRTAKGVNLGFISEQFGGQFAEHLQITTEKFLNRNILITQNNIFTFLPLHWYKADSIISELFFIEN